ncbi:MAG TPA: CDP-diacylglycerol--glycerol-3-phosphate 3-phosphatidyltransferase [Acidimicrobiales bacterium]|nr:CDP-diacylglycerol--glycerol-3-phosphate 3-phosphatidyltransferase [Acidimicrobiales bacterium]
MSTASSFGPSALLTPANAITLARLALTPVWLVVVVDQGPSWPAFLLGFVLAATDGIDGWLARKQGTTRSGAFLDPLADKFLVVGGLVALVVQGAFWWLPVGLIASREAVISLYRSWAGRNGISIPARWWAKVKTVVQELAIGAALLPVTKEHAAVRNTVLWVAVVLTLVTGAQYLLDGRKAARDPAL